MSDFTCPDGYTVDHERLQVHRRAVALMHSASGLDYLHAAILVAGQDAAAPAGYAVDSDRLALHREAVLLQARSAGRLDYPGAIALAVAPPATVLMRATNRDGTTTVRLRAAATMTAATFAGTAYSGGVAHDSGGAFAIDLADLELPADGRLALLMNHDPNRIAGSCTAANLGTQLRIEAGHFSAVTAAGREAAALHAEGHPFALSVGVNGRRWERCTKPLTTVNGRALAVASVLRGARLLEVSLVPAGADPAARLD